MRLAAALQQLPQLVVTLEVPQHLPQQVVRAQQQLPQQAVTVLQELRQQALAFLVPPTQHLAQKYIPVTLWQQPQALISKNAEYVPFLTVPAG